MDCTQVQLHNLLDLVQNENVDALVETALQIPRWQQQSIKPTRDPFKHGALCSCKDVCP